MGGTSGGRYLSNTRKAPMKCVSALSTVRNTEAALREVVDRAAGAMTGEPADLALIFASMHHADSLAEIAAEVTRVGLGRHVLGCTGESIIGEDREVEGTAALSLWSLQLPGIAIRPRRVSFAEGAFDGWPGLDAGTGATPPPARAERPASLLLLAYPFSFPIDLFLKRLHEAEPAMRVIGGMASGSHVPDQNRLVLDGTAVTEGAVAVELDGPITIRTVVSQGCRPIGRTAIVTRVEQNVIRELGRRPALEVLREVFDGLSEEDR
jgi:small ligand-binding sensory domain FIST